VRKDMGRDDGPAPRHAQRWAAATDPPAGGATRVQAGGARRSAGSSAR
jgi:hypothetical protein